MASLYIIPGQPGWEELLRYECEQYHLILLQRPEGDDGEEWMAKAEAILKNQKFERQGDPNDKSARFRSYRKLSEDTARQ
jgi:hypothetical protein